MDSQSLTDPQRHTCAALRIAAMILLCLLSASRCNAQVGISALAAPLILPSAIVFDSAGNLYVADTADHVVRRIDITGQISTVAGSGVQGFSGDNGPATSAALDSPQGLALDAGSTLYIADTHNQRIRKVNLTSGTITTLAGNGIPGYSGDSAPAIAAQLSLPTALAVDASENVFFADTGNNRIRRIDAATGVITSVAGNGTQGFSGDHGPAVEAAIDSPTGLAIASGSLYLADTRNQRIRRLDLTTGMLSTIAGTGVSGFAGDSGLAAKAAMMLPRGLAVDAVGDIYFADMENHRIRRIDAVSGVISTVAGDGIQSFLGDNGPAISAALNSPRSVALSASSLVTLADTGNQRIRQLDAAPAPGTEIHTIAGLGVTSPGALTLNAPSVVTYGTGEVIATFSTSSAATGSIAFLNTANGVSTSMGTAPLIANTATLSTSNLPAGMYSLTAAYTGDQTHLAAQSAALGLRIDPQPLTISFAPLSISYGQSIPALSGTIAGVLPQDAGNVSVSFNTVAFSSSPAGVYPVTGSLSGPAAGNYVLPAIAATITISPASTFTSLSGLVATAAAGSALTVVTQVANIAAGSTVASAPAGAMTLLDGTTPLATVVISASGSAIFSNISLSPGTHTLEAFYNGSANFAPSISSMQQIVITGGNAGPPSTSPSGSSADFTLAVGGASTQTILPGGSASFTFTIQPQGSMSSPITLAAAGLPSLATASFNPPVVPPGAAADTFALTIATPNAVASVRFLRPLLAIPVIPLLCLVLRPRHGGLPAKLLGLSLLSIGLFAASGCGNRVNTGSAAAIAASQSYTITVTGTATTSTGSILQHSTNVTLIVQPAS